MQQDEIDLDVMEQDNVTDSSDQRDFADIKKSLKRWYALICLNCSCQNVSLNALKIACLIASSE